MKLLFDQNLSPRLPDRIADLYPESSHVSAHGLGGAQDREVWEFARIEGLTLVTKDSDFNDLAMLRGFPPKLIWLRLGNCSTQQVETVLRDYHAEVECFASDGESGTLVLS